MSGESSDDQEEEELFMSETRVGVIDLFQMLVMTLLAVNEYTLQFFGGKHTERCMKRKKGKRAGWGNVFKMRMCGERRGSPRTAHKGNCGASVPNTAKQR